MKQILFYIGSVIILSNTTSFSQTTAFQESFDSGIPATFTMYNVDGLTPDASVAEYTNAWIGKTDPADPTNNVASATSYFSPVGSANRWLVTPAISLGNFGNTLTWQAKSHDASYSESYYVLVSTTDNAMASFTDTLETVFFEDVNWISHSVNLSENGYDGQTVYLAFVLRTYNGFKFYLDSINVEKDNPASVETVQPEVLVSIYPNPATNFVSIQSNLENPVYTFKDINGKIVLKSNGNKVDIQSLQKGMYIIECANKDAVITKRLIVE